MPWDLMPDLFCRGIEKRKVYGTVKILVLRLRPGHKKILSWIHWRHFESYTYKIFGSARCSFHFQISFPNTKEGVCVPFSRFSYSIDQWVYSFHSGVNGNALGWSLFLRYQIYREVCEEKNPLIVICWGQASWTNCLIYYILQDLF